MLEDNPETRRVERREVVEVDQPATVRSVPRTEEVAHQVGDVERHERVVTDAAGVAHRESAVADRAAERWYRADAAAQFVWIVAGIIEALIGFRVVLKLIAANPNNDFAHFIYSFSALFLGPFFGLTGSPQAGGVVLEIPSLIAMLVYAVVAWAIVRVVWLIAEQPATRSVSTYDRYES